jgi:hypothetical protein
LINNIPVGRDYFHGCSSKQHPTFVLSISQVQGKLRHLSQFSFDVVSLPLEALKSLGRRSSVTAGGVQVPSPY